MPAAGGKTEIEALDFADNGQVLLGSKMGSARINVDIPKLVALYEQKKLRLDELVTARYGLEQINEAMAAVNNGGALRNVIIFGEGD